MFPMITNPSYIHYDGKTQLHLACKDGSIELVKELLNQGVEINKQDSDGLTALHLTKNSEILKILIEAGANPNLQDYRSGFTPLLDAMVWLDEAKYTLLVPLTDLNLKSSFGYTALMFSAIYHRLDDMKLLIDAGADLFMRNYEGMDFYDFLMQEEKEYILSLFPEFLSNRKLLLDEYSIKARSKRIQ